MSLYSGRTKLSDGMKDLQRQWERAREDWHDEVAQRIEAEHIEPLLDRTRAALAAIGPLEEAIQRAKRECSEDSGGL